MLFHTEMKQPFLLTVFKLKWGKYTAYAKDRVKTHFKVLQIPTDLLTVWIKGHALNVHTLICITEYISFSLKSRHYPEGKKSTFLTSTIQSDFL